MVTDDHAIRPSMRFSLWTAAPYNLPLGGLVVFFPLVRFHWTGMRPPNYAELWQCIGMIVGVYGVVYAIAAWDPMRHWPIVLVGEGFWASWVFASSLA